MFDEAGRYEIQRERACFYYTYTPKLLCGEEFIKTEALLSCLIDRSTATFEGIMQTSRKKSEDEKAVLNYI